MARDTEQIILEVSTKYYAEHYDEIMAKRNIDNQMEQECEVCKCQINTPNWSRHLKSKQHLDNLDGLN